MNHHPTPPHQHHHPYRTGPDLTWPDLTLPCALSRFGLIHPDLVIFLGFFRPPLPSSSFPPSCNTDGLFAGFCSSRTLRALLLQIRYYCHCPSLNFWWRIDHQEYDAEPVVQWEKAKSVWSHDPQHDLLDHPSHPHLILSYLYPTIPPLIAVVILPYSSHDPCQECLVDVFAFGYSVDNYLGKVANSLFSLPTWTSSPPFPGPLSVPSPLYPSITLPTASLLFMPLSLTRHAFIYSATSNSLSLDGRAFTFRARTLPHTKKQKPSPRVRSFSVVV